MRYKQLVIWSIVVYFIVYPAMAYTQEYPPGKWQHIIANQEFTTPLRLDKGDDYTLIIGAVFHDIPDHAISIRNVSHVYIKDCVIYNIQGFGILLRETGSTNDITIDGCKIYNTTSSGIMATQRHDKGVDHKNVIIKNNLVYNNGQSSYEHNIYVQSSDVLVENNVMYGSTGNGISIRSSGMVRNNVIWDSSKSCIRYFNDHEHGPSNTLYIENNICYLTKADLSNHPGISLSRADTPYEWLLDNYYLRFNTIAVFNPMRYGISVESADFAKKYVAVYGNLVVNTWDISKTLNPQFIKYASRNYLTTSLDGFSNTTTMPYNFHLTVNSPARGYATGEVDYPLTDLDGHTRISTTLDVGAIQYTPHDKAMLWLPIILANLSDDADNSNMKLWAVGSAFIALSIMIFYRYFIDGFRDNLDKSFHR